MANECFEIMMILKNMRIKKASYQSEDFCQMSHKLTFNDQEINSHGKA
jgi:hypothetical protein